MDGAAEPFDTVRVDVLADLLVLGSLAAVLQAVDNLTGLAADPSLHMPRGGGSGTAFAF